MERRSRTTIVERRRHLELAGCTCLFLLATHRHFKPGGIHRHATLAADVGSQVERETESVVQLERRLAIEHALAVHRSQFAFEDGHAVLDGGKEPILFLLEHIGHALFTADQLRISPTHLGHQIGNHAMEEGGAGTELVTVTDGAADNAAQHVATPFVAGDDTIGNQE